MYCSLLISKLQYITSAYMLQLKIVAVTVNLYKTNRIGKMKNILDKEEFTKKGKTIYRKLQPKFKKDKGKIVAIEIESGDYFIGEDELEAAKKARGKSPDKIFVFFRIGHPAVQKLRKGCLI